MVQLLRFIACPSCSCHAKPTEVECPHCGARLRASDGSIARAAVAILLGLSAATAITACGEAVPLYGVAATSGNPVTTGGQGGDGGAGGQGGQGGAGGQGGTGG